MACNVAGQNKVIFVAKKEISMLTLTVYLTDFVHFNFSISRTMLVTIWSTSQKAVIDELRSAVAVLFCKLCDTASKFQ